MVKAAGKYFGNRKFLSSLLLLATLLISVNQMTIKSPVLGFCAALIYILVGGHLLGEICLGEEELVMRISLATLILLALLGLGGWFAVVFYRLGAREVILILFGITAFMILYPNARSLIARIFKRT